MRPPTKLITPVTHQLNKISHNRPLHKNPKTGESASDDPRDAYFNRRSLREVPMAAETLAFKTELKQLLHLIIHSLYSHPDIFLRELISNASDALDTVRFQSLTQPETLEDNSEWTIKLIPDAAAGTLTISDNGIGLSRETIV